MSRPTHEDHPVCYFPRKAVSFGRPVVKVMTGMAFSKDEFGEELKKAFCALTADGTYSQILHSRP